MNFLPLILGFLLFKAMSGFSDGSGKNASNSTNQSNGGGIFDNLENAQQALQLMSTFNKIRENKGDMGEMLGEIMSNPMAMNFVSSFMNNNAADSQARTASADNVSATAYETPPDNENRTPPQTETPTDSPSQPQQAASERTEQGFDVEGTETLTDTLFKPVEKIAGVELTQQLKSYYENWYVV